MSPRLIGLLLACLCLSLPASGADHSGRRPLKTKTCVRRDGAGNCREWDYTYSLPGAHCTEDCVKFSALDDCKLRNKCIFDPGSGCFKKRTCVTVNTLDDCTQWDEQPACD